MKQEKRSRPAVKIVEHLGSFEPPKELRNIVERLLLQVPPRYLAGLDAIVLRDEGGLVRREKQQYRRRLRKGEYVLGSYFRATSTRQARVELFVDRICARWPTGLMRIPPLRDIRIGSVLFHEIGHHIHRHLIADSRDPELVAKAWQRDLMRRYMSRRYWYLMPLFRLARFVLKRVSTGRDSRSSP